MPANYYKLRSSESAAEGQVKRTRRRGDAEDPDACSEDYTRRHDRHDGVRFSRDPGSGLADIGLFVLLIVVVGIILPGFPIVLRETLSLLADLCHWLFR